jgi:hypothetical protein
MSRFSFMGEAMGKSVRDPNALIAAYLASGGKITRVEPGLHKLPSFEDERDDKLAREGLLIRELA